MKLKYIALEHGNVEKLLGFEFASEMEAPKMEGVIDSLATERRVVSTVSSKKYKNYSASQISRFLEEGITVPKDAEMCMILQNTAYKLFNKFNVESRAILLDDTTKKHNRENPQKLLRAYSIFLVRSFDDNLSVTLRLANKELAKSFGGSFVSPSCAMEIRN